MFTRTKFFWFLLLLNLPPSLQVLYQEAGSTLTNDVVSTSNTNVLILGNESADINENDHTISNNLKATEIIQQIDVKDAQNHVISNINNVIISNESESLIANVKSNISLKVDSLELQNADNKVDLNNTVIPKENATIIVDSIDNIVTSNVTSPPLLYVPQNGSILANDTDTDGTKPYNLTVLGGKNATANESEEIKQRLDVKKEQITVLNTTINNVVVGSNDWIENYSELNSDYWNHNNGSQDNTTNNLVISNTIILEQNASIGNENLVSLNNLTSVGNESATNIVNQTITIPIDVRNSKQLLLNSSDVNNATDSSKGIETINSTDDHNNIAWRSLIPAKRKKEGKVKDIINSNFQNVSLEVNSLKNIKVNENNVSVEGLNNENDSTVVNTILNDGLTETVTFNNKYTEVPNTKLLINIDNSTNSKENISSISDISLITNNSSYLNNELKPNNTNLLNNYTTSINENDTYIDIAWRSDIPVRKNKSIVKDNIKLPPENKTVVIKLQSNNISSLANAINDSTLAISSNISNTNDENQDSENTAGLGDANNVFMILNSGNIERFSANLPVISSDPSNNQIVDTDIETHDKINRNNLKSSDSKLISAIINSTINKVASNILDHNFNSNKLKNIFLILNSGSISNFQLNSLVSDVLKNDSLDIDRSVKYSDDLKNINSKSVALKHSSTKSNNPILDIKFRRGVNKDTNSNKNTTKPLNTHTHNQTLQENPIEINDLPSNLTISENLFDDKNISSAEEPAYRSLLHLKNKTAVRARTVLSANNEININKNNDSVKPLPEPEAESNIGFDFNNLNLIGNALDLMKRLKRDTNLFLKDDPKYFWEDNKNAVSNEISDELTDNQKGEPCTDSTKCLNNGLLYELLKTSRRSLGYSKNNNLSKLNDNIAENSRLATKINDLECPLSAIVKLALHQLLDKFSNSKSALINNIYTTISSIIDGNNDPINLVTHLLWNEPFPIKLRLQLLHGDTSAFIAELNNYLDVSLCKL